MPVLVLNASYEPVNITRARRALVLLIKGVAVIEEAHDRYVHVGLQLPCVIRLRQYRRLPSRIQTLSRKNILIRDGHICQYCGEDFPAHDLTFDHLVPRSRGGWTTWENVVTACSCCNLTKGSQLPEEAKMFPRHLPIQPTTQLLRDNGRAFPPNYLHHSWRDFLYWDTELEAR